MTDYPPMHPVSGYGKPKRSKVPIVLTVLGVLLVLACGGLFAAIASSAGNGNGSTSADPVPQVAAGPSTPHGATPKGKPAPKVTSFGPGTYSVPADVKPGTYVTNVGDNDLDSCYWARLSKDGDPGSVILGGQGVLEHGAHGRMTVKSSDKGVQLMGDCVWTPSK